MSEDKLRNDYENAAAILERIPKEVLDIYCRHSGMMRTRNHMVIRGDAQMEKVQQDVMCALLQTLLENELITQDIHDKSREKILDTLDWPEFFCYDREERKEETYGSA